MKAGRKQAKRRKYLVVMSVAMLVAIFPCNCCRQPQNKPGFRPARHLLETLRGQVMALVDDQLPVLGNAVVDRALPDNALNDGDVVIAAITSCTNTANPANMMAAGLLALILGLVTNQQRANTTHREVVERRDDVDVRRRDIEG